MNVTVVYAAQDNLLHAVTVTNVTSEPEGKAKAQEHFEVICEAEGWAIQDFEVRSVETSDKPDYLKYLSEISSQMPVDPRD